MLEPAATYIKIHAMRPRTGATAETYGMNTSIEAIKYIMNSMPATRNRGSWNLALRLKHPMIKPTKPINKNIVPKTMRTRPPSRPHIKLVK